MEPHRILIVEDQREVSRLLRTSLETLDHKLEVVECPSGEEAILDASRRRVDVLVSDYRLPGISGIELMQKVRHFHPATKVILITGLTDPKVRKEVGNAGADSFFIKPVPIADFLDAVERHLGLVESLLPAEPISTNEETVHPGIPDLLSGLRQELGAKAVLLLNDRGRILARAGALPDASAEVSLTAALMAIFSAGQKVSSLAGRNENSGWHIFDAGDFHLVFAPLGATHALLAAGKDLAGEGRLLQTIEVFSSSCRTIRETLASLDVERAAPPNKGKPGALPATPEPEAEEGEDLEPLFKQARKKLKPEEVDAYWQDAAGIPRAAPAKPDAISYEQARRLGLAPEDENG
ncbi:MAG: response regulator [Chloroflexi bacterium]|nr:response regulator [Chloroflexota bacterium]